MIVKNNKKSRYILTSLLLGLLFLEVHQSNAQYESLDITRAKSTDYIQEIKASEGESLELDFKQDSPSTAELLETLKSSATKEDPSNLPDVFDLEKEVSLPNKTNELSIERNMDNEALETKQYFLLENDVTTRLEFCQETFSPDPSGEETILQSLQSCNDSLQLEKQRHFETKNKLLLESQKNYWYKNTIIMLVLLCIILMMFWFKEKQKKKQR